MFSLQKHSSGQTGFPTKLSHASVMPLKPRFVHFFVRPGGLRARQVSKRSSRTAPRPPKKHLKMHRNHPRIHCGLQYSVSGRPGVRPPTKNDQKWTQNGCKCIASGASSLGLFGLTFLLKIVIGDKTLKHTLHAKHHCMSVDHLSGHLGT